MNLGEQLLRSAVGKGLLSAGEAETVLARAQAAGREVSELLIEDGVLTQRTVDALLRESSATAPTVAHPPPDPDETLAVDATIAAPDPDAAPVPERLGEYELQERLGQGGMGAVYRARQLSLERHVALKVIAPRVAGDPETRQRFIREARVAAAINHPHVITIHQVGEDQGQVYMAMELVTGGDAEDLAQKAGGMLDERRALQLVRDACRGLVAIEAQGLIHRDIKPANLFLTADGSAKLADLGMARSQAGDDKVTQSGVIVGTPAYMAPEQAEGHACDIRADIYALGATLFRLCVGHPPYQGSSALRVMTKVLNDPVPDPRKANPRLSVATTRLITRCLAKRPDGRFPSAQALLAALDAALAVLDTPRRGWSSAPCTLLALFMLAGCFICSGLVTFLSTGAAGQDIRRVRAARVLTPDALATASGQVFLEGVRIEPSDADPQPELAGRAMLVLQTRVRSADERRDNASEFQRVERFVVAGHPVVLDADARFYGLQDLGLAVDAEGDAVEARGIPFDAPVSLLGMASQGTLRCDAVTTELTHARALEQLEGQVGPGNVFALACTLLGLVGLTLCLLLAARRRA